MTTVNDNGTDLSDEDLKLVTLARAARARIDAADSAAVRDRDGRSYAAPAITLPSLVLSGLELAVAQAVAAGATGLEAIAIVTDEPQGDWSAATEFAGPGVSVHIADHSGAVVGEATT